MLVMGPHNPDAPRPYKVTISGDEHLVLCFIYIHNIRRSVYHAVFGTQSPRQEVCHAM